MKTIVGNLQLMKKINMSLILNLVHREGRLSRAEIAQTLKLSPTTVSALVDELIQQKFIDEVGEKSSPGAGRKAIALEISRDKGYVISVGLGNNHFNAALLNFHNEIVYEFQQPIRKGNEPIYQYIEEAVRQLLASDAVKDASHIRGIAISSPGIIDEYGETIIKSTLLQIDQLAIKARLGREFDYPIIVVNDVKAAAFSEYYSGERKTDHLLFLSIDYGIGVGFVIDGKIYSGFKGASGEIGHIQIDPKNGLQCQCGKVGCIETALTEPYLLMKAQMTAGEKGISPLPQTFDELLERYDRGEEWVEDLFERACFLAGQTLASIINLLSPEMMVIHGWMNRSDKFFQKLKAECVGFPFPIPFDGNRIVPSSFGERGFLIGAATLMLHQIFRAYI